jgi:hypothetical protein
VAICSPAVAWILIWLKQNCGAAVALLRFDLTQAIEPTKTL